MTIQAPVAEKIPHKMAIHGDERIDNYYWMRDDQREDPKILAHLNAENEYTKAVMAHTEAFQQALVKELKARIKKDAGLLRLTIKMALAPAHILIQTLNHAQRLRDIHHVRAIGLAQKAVILALVIQVLIVGRSEFKTHVGTI